MRKVAITAHVNRVYVVFVVTLEGLDCNIIKQSSCLPKLPLALSVVNI